jgi:hypothetical protein
MQIKLFPQGGPDRYVPLAEFLLPVMVSSERSPVWLNQARQYTKVSKYICT